MALSLLIFCLALSGSGTRNVLLELTSGIRSMPQAHAGTLSSCSTTLISSARAWHFLMDYGLLFHLSLLPSSLCHCKKRLPSAPHSEVACLPASHSLQVYSALGARAGSEARPYIQPITVNVSRYISYRFPTQLIPIFVEIIAPRNAKGVDPEVNLRVAVAQVWKQKFV